MVEQEEWNCKATSFKAAEQWTSLVQSYPMLPLHSKRVNMARRPEFTLWNSSLVPGYYELIILYAWRLLRFVCLLKTWPNLFIRKFQCEVLFGKVLKTYFRKCSKVKWRSVIFRLEL